MTSTASGGVAALGRAPAASNFSCNFPLELRMGHAVTTAARRRGAIIRPLGDVVVLMPPLAISEVQLRCLVQTTAAAIEQATAPALRAAA